MGNVRVVKSSADENGIRIFVAGNNALEIFWLEMVFKGSRLPYTLEIAGDGEIAKNYLDRLLTEETPAPDLILFDANLPGAPSLETLDRLSAECRVPLFMMVCSDAPHALQDHLGSRRCVHKPFTHSQLQSCLWASAVSQHAKSSK